MPLRQELLLGASLMPNNRAKMLSDVAVMFSGRGETMAVRSKIELWSHHDEYSLVNESGSPTGTITDTTSCTLWHVFQSENCGRCNMRMPNILTYEMFPVVFAAISTSFWDQLIQTKANSDDLFAITTPHVDRSLKPSTPSLHSYGVRDTSQGILNMSSNA